MVKKKIPKGLMRKGSSAVEEENRKISSSLEKLIFNIDNKVSKNILKGLINFEEKDGNEVYIMVKR